MEVKTIRDSFHSQLLNTRGIAYIVDSEDFEIAYNNSTDKEQKFLLGIIERLEVRGLRREVVKKLKGVTPFHAMTLRELRVIAANLRIFNYGLFTKIALLKEIEDALLRLKENSNRSRVQPQQTNQVGKNITGRWEPPVLANPFYGKSNGSKKPN